jgi:hypothetical protein
MTNAQHTPGPWQDNDAGRIYAPVPVGADEAPFVADCCNNPGSSQCTTREKANASLIAAAPELLEALESLFDDWLTLVDIDLDEENPDCLAIEANTRAAITKAKGGRS